MIPLWGPVAGIFIVLMMLAFIGVWVWAWLPRHKRHFGAMASLPLEDEQSEGDEHASGAASGSDR